MKKLMSLVALAVVASVVAASAQEVLSANAVGYVKRTVPAGGKFQIVSIPFENIASDDGTYKFGDTQIAQDLPVGSEVMFWDDANQGWSGGNKGGTKGWGNLANRKLAVGEAFFVKNNTDADLDVTAAGEVPSDSTLKRSYNGSSSFTTVAAPYPVDVKFGDTEIAQQLPVGSEVMFWDAANQGWVGGNKGAAKGWATYANRSVAAGEGFFVKTASEGTWEAVKPYTWP